MFYNRIEIMAIKIAICNIEMEGISSKDTLRRSISWLRDNYERAGEREYLKKALCNIYAYLELGFPYEEEKDDFLKILEYLHLSEEELFLKGHFSQREISLSKANIRGLIGKWNPVLHSMKIDEVIEDIFRNVSEGREGKYIYYCGKPMEGEGENVLWEHTYNLYVYKEEAVFYDVNKSRYYVFA